MKTIILYATKHGAAGEIAQRIAEKIDGAVVHDLKQALPSLADFDCIIVGGSIYAGSIRKEAKTFLTKNAEILKEKKLGLFLCGLDSSGKAAYFEKNIPADILQTAKAKSFLGGIFDPKKTGAMERFIIKIVTKQSCYMSTIKDEKIVKFAEQMKA
ncbi:MAG: flavodoxin domain-containing protein [Treponema sp.]|nr:flavodoxin domain-containing protein [Treponema sp.]